MSTNILTSNDQILASQTSKWPSETTTKILRVLQIIVIKDQSVMFVKLPSTSDIQPMTIELYGIKQNTNHNYQQNQLKRLELKLICQLNWVSTSHQLALVSSSKSIQMKYGNKLINFSFAYQLFYFGGLKILFILKRQEHNV